MRPDLDENVFDKQIWSDQKFTKQKGSKERDFLIGEQVLVKKFQGEPKWPGGTATEQTDHISYEFFIGYQPRKRPTDQNHQTQIARPYRSADVSETSPKHSFPEILIVTKSLRSNGFQLHSMTFSN